MPLANLAHALEAEGKLVEAEAAWREELAVGKNLFGEEHQFVANSLQSIACVILNQGRPIEAEPVFREALEISRKARGNEHPTTKLQLGWLGSVLQKQGKHSEAVALFREDLDHARAADGKGWVSTNSGLGVVLCYFAEALSYQNEFKEARPPAEQAWALFEQHPDWPQDERNYSYKVLDAVLAELNDQPARETLQRKELDRLRGKLPSDDPELAGARAVLTLSVLTPKKFAEAEAPARACLAIRERKMPDSWLTFNALSLLGGSLLGQKKYTEAEPLLLSGYEGMQQRELTNPAGGKVRIPEALHRLVQLYEAIGRADKATEHKQKLAEFDKASK